MLEVPALMLFEELVEPVRDCDSPKVTDFLQVLVILIVTYSPAGAELGLVNESPTAAANAARAKDKLFCI